MEGQRQRRLLQVRPVSAAPPSAQDPWSQASRLVAGPLAWGGIGYGLDTVTGSSLGLPVGLVFGFVAALAWVLYSYAVADTEQAHARSAGPVGPTAAPDHRSPRPGPADRQTPTSDGEGERR